MSEFVVNKIGGTSAGSPENITNLAASPEGTFIPEDHDSDPDMALVVSAIALKGSEGKADTRVTEVLKEYWRSVEAGLPDMELRDTIIGIHESVYSNLEECKLKAITDELASDLLPDETKTEADYVSQGEEYSARLLAEAIGAQYVEPRHITFGEEGYDISRTVESLKKARASGEFDSERPLVYAGYFGFDRFGNRQLLDRGGSDRTAAALAIGLDSDFYGKWSDIEGIHTANPEDVPDTAIRPNMTFAEIREYALGGNPVLSGRTPVDLDQFGWDGTILIRSTSDPDEPGTRITSQPTYDESQPVAAIASRDVDMVSINDIGMAHAVGYVARAARHAEELGLSISHFPAGNDALTFVIDPDSEDAAANGNGGVDPATTHEQRLEALEQHLRDEAMSPNADSRVEQERALLVLVGEALRLERVRTLTSARANLALLKGGVAVRDTLGNIKNPSLIFDVSREFEVNEKGEKESTRARTARQLAHSELISDPVMNGLIRIPHRRLRQYQR